ncbi:hypothetical protein AVEN_49516-1 [Araneus ventricosus]|uniref:Uncharacterized protein n=1 Tax=Araneus ventricosus TaxID=182803 RepID=A0A4Y2V4A8_ARAVE|nr:hypothetical protein AVEN_49516-1 [Araneus ventricosus]
MLCNPRNYEPWSDNEVTSKLEPFLQTSAPHQRDQGCELYPINKAEIEKRKVVQMLHDTPPSTSKEAVETPSVSKEGNEVSAVSKAVASPLKELKLAILSTLSPPTLSKTKISLKNSKAKRKQMQATNMVAYHLHEECKMKKACSKNYGGKETKSKAT